MSTQTSAPDRPRMLTPADAAQVANVSTDTVYRLIDRGELRAIHVGRLLRIDPTDLDRYLNREASQ